MPPVMMPGRRENSERLEFVPAKHDTYLVLECETGECKCQPRQRNSAKKNPATFQRRSRGKNQADEGLSVGKRPYKPMCSRKVPATITLTFWLPFLWKSLLNISLLSKRRAFNLVEGIPFRLQLERDLDEIIIFSRARQLKGSFKSCEFVLHNPLK